MRTNHTMKTTTLAIAAAMAAGTVAHAQEAVQWRVEDGGNGHWYVPSLPHRTWDDAALFGSSNGGSLASLGSAGELHFANSVVSSIGITVPWIGAYQDLRDPLFNEPASGWTWTDGTPWLNTLWAPGEPNNVGGTEHVGQLWASGLNDAPASELRPSLLEFTPDCNGDGVTDFVRGFIDGNRDGIPDVCQCLPFVAEPPVGCTWTTLGDGSLSHVSDVAAFDDGNGIAVYAAGRFPTNAPAIFESIARWDGREWQPIPSGPNGPVSALAVFDDGSGPALYAGGSFSHVGSLPASNIARWNGNEWTALGSGVNGWISANGLIAVQGGPFPGLYATGSFTYAGTLAVNRIARWSQSAWHSLKSGLDGPGRALACAHDETTFTMYVGGSFSTAGGLFANRIAAWDGKSWTTLGGGFDNTVRALCIRQSGPDRELYAGGVFRLADNTPASGIARWDNSSWNPIGSGVTGGSGGYSAQVLDLLDFAHDGTRTLVVSGNFTHAGGTTAPHVAVLAHERWMPVDSGLSHWAGCLARVGDGFTDGVFIGGAFTLASGFPATRVVHASWTADCDGDGLSDNDAIAGGASDCNNNGLPDSCETAIVLSAPARTAGFPQSPATFQYAVTSLATSDVIIRLGLRAIVPNADISIAATLDQYPAGTVLLAETVSCDASLAIHSLVVPQDQFNSAAADGHLILSLATSDPIVECPVSCVTASLEYAAQSDCDRDGTWDTCQIVAVPSADANHNGILDTCECLPDINADGVINGADISVLLGYWGLNGKPVAADINQDGQVDGTDLANVLGSWGECP